MSTSVIVNSNNLKIAQYWSEFNKSGKSHTIAICYSAVRRGDIHDEIAYFKKTMYCLNKADIKILQKNAVLLFWSTEIEYIYKYIRHICEGDAFPLSHLELFKWMKEQDCDNYKKFKNWDYCKKYIWMFKKFIYLFYGRWKFFIFL